jgi:hypothetical protein
METSDGTSSFLALMLSFIINMFILTYFVCIIADISDALLMCVLVENYLRQEKQNDPNTNKIDP